MFTSLVITNLWASNNSNNTANFDERLKNFNQIIELKLGDQWINFGLVYLEGNSLYYADMMGEKNLKISANFNDVTTYSVEIYQYENAQGERTLSRFVVEDNFESFSTYVGSEQNVERVRFLRTNMGTEKHDYWLSEIKVDESTHVFQTLKFLNDVITLNTTRQVGTPQTFSGLLEYNRCDGCEHGDQLLIGGINLVAVSWGEFYKPGCQGELHHWVQNLLERKRWDKAETIRLEVPITYHGLMVNHTKDYRDSLEELSMGTEGIIYLGSSTQGIPLSIISTLWLV